MLHKYSDWNFFFNLHIPAINQTVSHLNGKQPLNMSSLLDFPLDSVMLHSHQQNMFS